MADEMLTPELIEATKAFHGHSCPGLAVGMRAAEVCLNRVGRHSVDEEMVAVVETDMCGVDAVQFLTGCTFGKGNLIHQDYGKNAFTFYNRRTGQALRVIALPGAFAKKAEDKEEGLAELRAKAAQGRADEDDLREISRLMEKRITAIMTLELKELFDIQPVTGPPPSPARVMTSLTCADCGEQMMENRSRRFGGRELCIPCFNILERRTDC